MMYKETYTTPSEQSTAIVGCSFVTCTWCAKFLHWRIVMILEDAKKALREAIAQMEEFLEESRRFKEETNKRDVELKKIIDCTKTNEGAK